MNVLIACEESQRVCLAFRAFGHEAYSCDLLACSGAHPEWHIKCDVLKVINGNCFFYTMDGIIHYISDTWDLVIAHPPCTRLTNSGHRWLFYGDEDYRSKKIQEQRLGIQFFMEIVNCNAKRLAIENPVGIMSSLYRKPDMIYNPYDFYPETECKKTCLWLRNLPLLKSNQNLPLSERIHNMFKGIFNGKQYAWNSSECSRLRSQTPFGVAEAMAKQWGSLSTDITLDEVKAAVDKAY